MLAEHPAGESPARGNCPVDTVAILGDGDQSVESPRVKVSEGQAFEPGLIRPGRRTTRQVVAIANWSPPKPVSHWKRMVGGWRVPSRWDIPAKARAVGSGTGYMTADGLSGVAKGDMSRRMSQRKHGTSGGSPRRSRTAKAWRISRRDGEVAMCLPEGQMGSNKR